MKNFVPKSIILIVICLTGCSRLLYAQVLYKISNSKDINMKISGTSTLHKWAMNTQTFEGQAEFGFTPGNGNQISSVKHLNFSLTVTNLKSGEKGLDKNAYKALKTDAHKDILYKLTAATVMPEKEKKYLIKTEGNLTIAGVTKEVTMDVYCLVNKDASITCNGSDKLKMTDYQVKPPSFMMGAMKTGDAITLDFTLVYTKQAGN
jgi:polyisoprenoid-binding protein YceI